MDNRVRKDDITSFVRDTELVGIKLVEVKTSLLSIPEEGKNYSINLKTNFPFNKDQSNVVVLCNYNLNFTNDKGEDAGIIKFSCVFSIHYVVKNLSTYSDKTIKLFSDNNAKFNSWSYFRELLSNTAMRMELGSLVTPLLKPRPHDRPVSSSKK